MIDFFAGWMHIFVSMFMSFYIFIIPKNFLCDFIYITYSIIIFILWCIHKECPFTYYYYKYTGKIDYEEAIDVNGYIYIICEKIFSIMLIVSIYVATTRSKIMPFKLLILCLFLKILFDILIKNKILKKNKNLEDIYVTTMLVLSSLLLLYVIYINKNRFNIK